MISVHLDLPGYLLISLFTHLCFWLPMPSLRGVELLEFFQWGARELASYFSLCLPDDVFSLLSLLNFSLAENRILKG